MEICSGDSTPTSETSYSHSHTPTPHSGLIPSVVDGNISTNNGSLTGPGPVLLANALPRLASHPPPSQPSPTSSGPIRLSYQGGPQGVSSGVTPCVPPGVPPPCLPPGVPLAGIPPPGVPPTGVLPPGVPPPGPPPPGLLAGLPPGVPPGAPTAAASVGVPSTVSAIPVISSTPPASVSSPCNPPVTLANLPHLLSQITQSQDTLSPQKALKTIQSILSAQSSTPGPAPGSPPLVVDTSHTGLGDGPPTPTHSETQDCVDARKR